MISWVYPISFHQVRWNPSHQAGSISFLDSDKDMSATVITPFKVGVRLQPRVANIANYVGTVK